MTTGPKYDLIMSSAATYDKHLSGSCQLSLNYRSNAKFQVRSNSWPQKDSADTLLLRVFSIQGISSGQVSGPTARFFVTINGHALSGPLNKVAELLWIRKQKTALKHGNYGCSSTLLRIPTIDRSLRITLDLIISSLLARLARLAVQPGRSGI